MFESKADILDALRMPKERFSAELMPQAYELMVRRRGGLQAVAMLGYTNICKNQCLYCGMRAGNNTVPRFRLSPDEVLEAGRAAVREGYHRLFLVAGEDPKYGFDSLLDIVSGLHGMGLALTLACGEFSAEQYRRLKAAGADEYVLKFEMSDPVSFDRLNPSTNFKKRMEGIRLIQESGLALASGNIVGWPGQSLEQLADDILLMRQLSISWAPVIPYLPAKNTPLAAEGGPGDQYLNLREITLLRLMMPDLDITAQQPGPDPSKGLGDEQGNLAAVHAGANRLFVDLADAARAGAFRVIDNRNIIGTDHARRVAALAGLPLEL